MRPVLQNYLGYNPLKRQKIKIYKHLTMIEEKCLEVIFPEDKSPYDPTVK